MRQQSAAGVDHREVFLVVLHAGDERFSGNLEEFLVEPASDGHRPFHQRGNFIEQVVVDQRLPAQLFGLFQHLGAYRFAPRAVIGQHLSLGFQDRQIGLRLTQVDGVGMMETVPARITVCLDAENLRIDDFVTEQQHHPVHRPDEFLVAVTPAHALGNRQPGERFAHQFGNHPRRVLALANRTKRQPAALFGLELVEFLDLDTTGSGETLCRGCGTTVIVESGTEGGPAPHRFLVFLGRGNIAQQQRQPARCRVTQHAGRFQRGGLQARNQSVGERIGQAAQRFRRQLLGADLDQQVAGVAHGAASRCNIGNPSDSRRS